MLRGLGVSMAFPWLESHAVWGDEPVSRGKASAAPIRLGVFFAGNGFHSKGVVGQGGRIDNGTGPGARPAPRLPRANALYPGSLQRAGAKGEHPQFSDGQPPVRLAARLGGEIRSGTSVDQHLAATYGRSTKVSSLVLGCEKSNPSVHKNYSMLYSSHISWTSPTTPTPLELYPALAFDRFFKGEARRGDAGEPLGEV